MGYEGLNWVQGLDLNQRPSGYEPDELPDCSTLQCEGRRDLGRGALSVNRHFHFALASDGAPLCSRPLCHLTEPNHNHQPNP